VAASTAPSSVSQKREKPEKPEKPTKACSSCGHVAGSGHRKKEPDSNDNAGTKPQSASKPVPSGILDPGPFNYAKYAPIGSKRQKAWAAAAAAAGYDPKDDDDDDPGPMPLPITDEWRRKMNAKMKKDYEAAKAAELAADANWDPWEHPRLRDLEKAKVEKVPFSKDTGKALKNLVIAMNKGHGHIRVKKTREDKEAGGAKKEEKTPTKTGPSSVR
jgi:hypothetical protein